MIDLGYRAYSHRHNYRLDPIIRSLMDIDFYKFLMGQVIWRNHRHIDVTFALINRSKHVRLADIIPEAVLREHLDHTRSLSFIKNELIWLTGNTFYGQDGIFDPEYIDFLRNFRLPEYDLQGTLDGQYLLHFPGEWAYTTYWETYVTAIVNELRNRFALDQLGRFELDVLYSHAKTKLWTKLQRLKQLDNLNLSDAGTRRRHNFLFQEWAVLAAQDALGAGFAGTSNAYLAMKHGMEAKGTNAHERHMVAAALANSDEEMIQSQYDVLAEWQHFYEGALRVMLPDTYGTTGFLERAPDWIADWSGIRYDSKKPDAAAGEEGIQFWQRHGRDPRDKLALFMDGLDDDLIIALHDQFNGRTRVGFGWGTLLTNDFRGCHPNPYSALAFDPISLICKPTWVNGRHAVKLSDNYAKGTGDAEEIKRVTQVFGTAGMTNVPVIV